MTYLFVFFSSSISAHIVQHSRSKYKKIFWAFICVILPAVFLGGLRSSTLGTDNYVYYSRMFDRYHDADSIFNLPSNSTISEVYYEPFFALLMYLVTRFTDDYHWFCFFTVLIQMIIILKALLYFKDDVSVGFSLLAYYLMFFCPLINIIRQGMAMAVCLYSLRYCFEKDIKKFMLCIAAAMCFHVTAIVFSLAYFITLYKNTKHQNKKIAWIIVGIIIVYVLSPYIGKFLLDSGILRSHYAQYIPTTITFKFSQFLYRIPLVMLMGLFLNKLAKKNPKWYSIFLFLIVDIVLSQVAGVLGGAVRIAYYFGILAVICYSGICRLFYARSNRLIVYSLALVYLLLYWLYWTVFNNLAFNMPVFPYVSDVIEWLF